jgi:hypothetical protein
MLKQPTQCGDLMPCLLHLWCGLEPAATHQLLLHGKPVEREHP